MRTRVWLGILALSVAGGSASKTAVPSLHLESCRLQHPERAQSVGARCGWLEVAENPDAPAGTKIRLRVAVVPALDQDGPPTPCL